MFTNYKHISSNEIKLRKRYNSDFLIKIYFQLNDVNLEQSN